MLSPRLPHIAAKCFAYGSHNFPGTQTVFIRFQVVQDQLVCRRFPAGIDAEGQAVAGGGASLLIRNTDGEPLADGVPGRR